MNTPKKIHNPFTLLLFAVALFATTSACAEQESSSRSNVLCNSAEVPAFSFKLIKNGKILSICREKNNKYIVYRFGELNHIELQYPEYPDESSWNKFKLSGLYRGGGAMNDAFGDLSLDFENNGVAYSIFQKWRVSDQSSSIGVFIVTDKGNSSSGGDPKSQVGSLLGLKSNPKINYSID